MMINQTNKSDAALAILIKGISYYEQKINCLKILLQQEECIQKCMQIVTPNNWITSKDLIRFFCLNLRNIKTTSLEYIFKRISDSHQISKDDFQQFIFTKFLRENNTTGTLSRLKKDHQIKETLLDLFETLSKEYKVYFQAQQEIVHKYNLRVIDAYKILQDKDQHVSYASLQRTMERNNFKFTQDDYAVFCFCFFKKEMNILTQEDVEEIFYGSGPKTDKIQDLTQQIKSLQNSRQSNNVTYSFYNKNNQIYQPQQMISILPNVGGSFHDNLGNKNSIQRDLNCQSADSDVNKFSLDDQQMISSFKNLVQTEQSGKILIKQMEDNQPKTSVNGSRTQTETKNLNFFEEQNPTQQVQGETNQQIKPMYSPDASLQINQKQKSPQNKLKPSKNYFTIRSSQKKEQNSNHKEIPLKSTIKNKNHNTDQKLFKNQEIQKSVNNSQNPETNDSQNFLIGNQAKESLKLSQSMYQLRTKNHVSNFNNTPNQQDSLSKKVEYDNKCKIF